MHYYQFNIGDYIKHTSHLTPIEDITYRRLLDLYYDTEQPITQNNPVVSRRLRVPEECVEIILNEFFTLTENGWVNARADAEIAEYHAFAEKQKANGIKGGRPKKTQNNPSLTQAEPKITLTTNHKPLTINHKEHTSLADANDPCPQQAIIDLYHRTLPTMPRVREWTPARQAKLRARWKEKAERQNLDWWADWFGFIAESDFLCGRTKKPFVCNLEWLITPANFVKVLEGNYENNEVTA